MDSNIFESYIDFFKKYKLELLFVLHYKMKSLQEDI